MAFYGKCSFCFGNGHNINMCNHPNKFIVMNEIKMEIEAFNTRAELKRYIQRLPYVHLALLGSKLKLTSNMPRVLLVNLIINHYVCALSVRNMRISRYELEIEENAPTTQVPPYSLFRRCLEVVERSGHAVSNYLFGNRSARYAGLANTDAHSSVSNTPLFQIIPELSYENNGANGENEHDCPICMECKELTQMITPACSHSLCSYCFLLYVGKTNNIVPHCPVCREQIKNIKVYDVQKYNECVKKFVHLD